MSWNFVVKRVALFLIVVWAAASVNFFVPRLGTGRDPIREKLGQLAASGGLRQDGIEAMVKAYQIKFGLDKPLHVQYLNFLSDTFTLDLGYFAGQLSGPRRADHRQRDPLDHWADDRFGADRVCLGHAHGSAGGLADGTALYAQLGGADDDPVGDSPLSAEANRALHIGPQAEPLSAFRAGTRPVCWRSSTSPLPSTCCTIRFCRQWLSSCSRSASGRWECGG